ncbi:protein of unknown function [Xenorhabdus poinarii G6]|uniref:Uncharacterized protein n=1 Tax=Xenorhabdus poinarii G6 TaxID=1354304 RepID=A0A068QYT3_9GAMM|nr:hypothetical protein [Xenorhabdus poinarii]CDG19959.1 protein of unknown function [Xenorhabdus poinarii G6]
MTKPHPHADLMMKAAEIAQENENWWEHFQCRGKTLKAWRDCQCELSFVPDIEYRLKPRTIKIGEYDIPEPVREPLAEGQECYIPNIRSVACPDTLIWSGALFNIEWLESGLIHLDSKSAEIHARALVSLTAKNNHR